MLTAERLKELLHYDPETGVFTNIAPRKKIRVGSVAGTVDPSHGYIVIGIDRGRHYAHRLAFLYMTGDWPKELVDHRDGVRTNNIFTNLRDAPRIINQQNIREAKASSSSGLLGAYRKRKRWTSQIKIDGKLVRLGVFDTAEEANSAYISAKRQHHAGFTI